MGINKIIGHLAVIMLIAWHQVAWSEDVSSIWLEKFGLANDKSGVFIHVWPDTEAEAADIELREHSRQMVYSALRNRDPATDISYALLPRDEKDAVKVMSGFCAQAVKTLSAKGYLCDLTIQTEIVGRFNRAELPDFVQAMHSDGRLIVVKITISPTLLPWAGIQSQSNNSFYHKLPRSKYRFEDEKDYLRHEFISQKKTLTIGD